MTDGRWVWSLAWSDHVRHAVSLRFSAPEVSVEQALEVARAEVTPMPVHVVPFDTEHFAGASAAMMQ